jgi:hypothetical protein
VEGVDLQEHAMALCGEIDDIVWPIFKEKYWAYEHCSEALIIEK